MTFTPGLVCRSMSRICLVESMLTFKPNSRFASAAPDMMPWRRYIRLMSGVKRDWRVSKDVRSASKQRVSTLDGEFVRGMSGFQTSVNVSLET